LKNGVSIKRFDNLPLLPRPAGTRLIPIPSLVISTQAANDSDLPFALLDDTLRGHDSHTIARVYCAPADAESVQRGALSPESGLRRFQAEVCWALNQRAEMQAKGVLFSPGGRPATTSLSRLRAFAFNLKDSARCSPRK
jgi:hypothetical protein